jgi:hypothetical protein
MEPSVLYAEMEVSESSHCKPSKIQRKPCLNGGTMQPELHFTGDGGPTGDLVP